MFPLPTDNKRHRYCQKCYSEKVKDVDINKKRMYKCGECGEVFDRLIDIDPKIEWWIDQNTKEYYHETAGIFVSNNKKELLLIERTLFPYAMTVPAGHVDKGEDPTKAALRELWEETGIKTKNLVHFKSMDIDNDPCRRGADIHKWHIYKYLQTQNIRIKADINEGKNPKWLSLDESLQNKLTQPVFFLLKEFGNKLLF